MSSRFRELQARNEALQDERTELVRLLDDEREEHQQTDAERARAEDTARKLRRLLVADGRADEAWSEETVTVDDDRPDSFDDLLDRVDKLTHVEFTGDPEQTRQLDERDPLGTWANKCWDALLALDDYATAVAEGRFSGGVDAYLRNVPSGCHGFSANRHARDESDTVKNNSAFARHRRLPVPPEVSEDGEVFMGAHFKITQSRMLSPRMHYHDDTARSGRIYIGYIGRHLPTQQTN